MKKLTIGMVGLVLLALQVNAQQIPASPTSPVTPPSPASTPSVSVNTTVRNHSRVTVTTDGSTRTWINDQEQSDDPTKTKTFSKSFSIDKNDKINLSNQFGSITIKTWDKNEIKVDADIKAYASTETEAQKLIDDATINATKEGDNVTFRGTIGETNGNWGSGSRNGKKWRREVKIYITVYMPANNSLSVSQQYGNIVLDDFSGPTSLKAQYGNITTGDLKNANNYVNVQYGKANLQNVNQAKIKHQYGGGLTIATIGTIDLEAQYTSATIGAIKGNAEIKHQYGGGVTIGTIGGALNADAQYTSIKIGTLKGNIKTKIQYGKLIVETIESGTKAVDVNADYSTVNLGFGPGFNADFDVMTTYGSFKYGENVTAKKQFDDRGYNSSKNYTGQIGKGGSAKVSIKSEYNSVTFK